MLRSILLLLVFAMGPAFLGCTKATIDPAQLAQHKQKFALAEEPEEVQTVFEVRETLLGHTDEDHEHAGEEGADEDHADDEHAHEGETAEEHAAHTHEHDHEHVFPTESKEVAMVGQVGGLANPWEETQPEFPFSTHYAVFFLADPQAIAEHAEEGHVHAPGEECAFCAAHAEENSELFAMVRLLDDNGKPIPVDVREILDVKEHDTVVVKGSAQILEGGMLVVKANGLYVRK